MGSSDRRHLLRSSSSAAPVFNRFVPALPEGERATFLAATAPPCWAFVGLCGLAALFVGHRRCWQLGGPR
jgi:hypothetical protein